MAGIKFDITGDNGNFLSACRGAEEGVRHTAQAMDMYGQQIEKMFDRIKTAAELSVAGFSAKEFAQKVALVRGEFQQLEVAFKTMLGSEEKATAMMNDLVRLAATTPFDLKGVAGGAKQLLAYGFAAEDITDTLRRLGDIAAGLGIQLGDLTYLYGTTMAQGRLYTQDLNQFTGRGIPMISELAKQFGVAESKVKDLVEQGKVGFPEVQKVIMSLTNEGGKFGGLMEAQSHTIVGQISNIEDSIDMMFNELGQQSEGTINTMLSGASFAVDHYKELGSVILGIAASYGEWKAALMVVSAYQNVIAKQQMEIENTRQADLQNILDEFDDSKETASTEANTAAEEQNTIARNANKSAIDAEIAAMENALKAKLAEAEADYNNATTKAAQASLAVDAANEAVDAAEEQYEAVLKTGNAEKIEAAELELNTAAAEANSAQKALLTARENVATAATNKNTAAEKLNTFQTKVDATEKKAAATATGIWTAVTNGATKAVRGLTAAIAGNPIGALLVGITTVMSLLPMFSSETSEASEEVTRFGEAAVKQTNDVETLLAVIESTSDTSKVHKDAVNDLCQIYDEYGIKIDKEQDQLQQLIAAHDELIGKIREEGEERQKANLIQSYEEGMSEALEEMRTAWSKAYKNAEYDGSGLIDDWDANAYKEAADQISLVANTIAQNEMEQLQAMIANGEEVTEEQIAQAINTATEKIKEQSEKLAGSSLYTSSYDEIGNEIRHYVDVDYEGIMETYAEKVLRLAGARQELVSSIKETKSAMDDENETLDYSSMEFSELISKAYEGMDAVNALGDSEAEPTVNDEQITNATEQADNAKSAISTLGITTAFPKVNASSICFANDQANQLLSNLNLLSSNPLLAQGGFNFNLKPNMGSGTLGTYDPFNSPAVQAHAELLKRVKDAKTDKQVKDLIKDIDSAIEDAEYGSYTRKSLMDLKKQLSDRKKSNDGSDSDKKKKKQEADRRRKEALQRQKDEEKYQQLLQKQGIERERAIVDMEFSTRQAEINAMNEGSAKTLAQYNLDFDKKKVEIERGYEDLKRKKIENARALWEADPRNKGKKFDESTVDTSYTGAEKANYAAMLKANEHEHAENQRRIAEDEMSAMESYLEQYGTFQQRKLAIAQDYQRRIDKAQTEGERLTLQEQMKSALANVDTEAIKQKIDWAGIFGNMGGMLFDELRTNLEELKKYMQTDEYKSLTLQDQKQIAQLADDIQVKIGAEVDFGNLASQTERLQTAMSNLSQAEQNEQDAIKSVQFWQTMYNGVVSSGTKYVKAYETMLNQAKERQAEATEAVKTYTSEVQDAAQELHGNVKNITSTFDGLADGLNKLKSGSLQSAYEGLGQTCSNLSTLIGGKIGKALGTFAEGLGGVIGQIIGAVLSILDVLKDGISKIITDLLDTIFNAINGILHDILSGELVTNILGSVIDGLTNIFDTLSFGALGSWLGGNKDDMEKEIAKLTTANENLAAAIDGLKDSIANKDSTNSSSVEAYKKAVAAEKEWEQNQRKAINARASEYSNSGHGFLGLGGKHSFNYFLNDKGSGWSGWSDFNNALKMNGVNKTVGSAQDIWNLSPEEMKLLRDFAPTAWSQLLNTDGESNPKDLLDAYIERSGMLDELTSALNEKLTGYSWDGFKSSFSSMLTDLSSDTQNFADNMEKMLSNAILNSLMNTKYNDRIKALYKKIAEAAEDNDITKEEADTIREINEGIANDMLKDRQNLIDLGIIKPTSDTYSQQASSKGFNGMTQEQGGELNGRFTALQVTGENISAQMITAVATLTGIAGTASSTNTAVLEIRNMMINTNSYLEDLVKYSKFIYNDFMAHLEDISNNTKNA